MATKVFTAFFTTAGSPVTGLTPTISIYNLTTSTLDVAAAAMTETSAINMPGWYHYAFITYNYDEDYINTVDGNGGAAVPLAACDRYKYGGNDSFAEDNAYMAWEEDNTIHTNPNTTGQLLNLITAVLVNRTKIDIGAATLTVYDSDCVTPLIVFDLKDSVGNPSVVEVCERVPTTCP